MRVPMQWMKQYTEIPVSAEAFQDAMIMHGTGVEGLEDQNEAVQNVVVGKILSVRKHENSDHMVICSIDVVRMSRSRLLRVHRMYMRAIWSRWPRLAPYSLVA